MDRLIEMLERAYELAMAVQDEKDPETYLALAEEISGECAEFLALWENDLGAFDAEETADSQLVELVEKLQTTRGG